MAMSIFVRKHWRKIILALTTAFWSSCDSDSTTNPPVECEGQECVQESSSSTEAPSSSSTETPSSSSIESSSSEEIQMSAMLYGVFYSSSDPSFSSSSCSEIEALYGVFYSSSDPSFSSSSETPSSSNSDAALSSSEDIQYSSSLYGVFYSSSDPSFSSSSEQRKIICYNYNSNGKITCDDGLTCEETVNPISDCTEGPCPVYGVPSPQDISYKCDNDETYTQEEFLKDHEIWSNAALYGVFYNSSSDESASSDKKN